MALLRYISHADVVIDPDVPVPEWGLSDVGRQRVVAMLDQPWIPSITRVITSAETKSTDAGRILGDHLGLEIEVRPCTGETDRSSTGFVPKEEHDRLAAAYFAEPHQSARGWERSIDSQRRIVDCLDDLLDPNRTFDGDVAVVGHGGVGTLLWCWLSETAIDQRHDQPWMGNYWTYDLAQRRMRHAWRRIDDIES